jgi:hypothetical protein
VSDAELIVERPAGVEVTDQPHRGCAKFSTRFGAKVVIPGTLRVHDEVVVDRRAGRGLT